jgi:hypothetical protein
MDINALDQAVKIGQEQTKASAAALEERFERDVVDRLEEFVSAAPGWKADILSFAQTATRVVEKAEKTPYAADSVIVNAVTEIRAAIDSMSAVDRGLADYKKLGPQDLLLRDGRCHPRSAHPRPRAARRHGKGSGQD